MRSMFCLKLMLFFFGVCVQAQSEETSSALVTTTDVPITTIAPLTTTTTTPVEPIEGSWNVTDGNVTCIRANLKIRFMIPDGNDTKYVVLPPDADSSQSKCDLFKDHQLLVLQTENFTLAFLFEKDSANTYVKNISLTLPVSVETAETFYNDSKQFSVQNGYSFMCKSKSTLPLGNATMEIFDIRIQAYGGTEDKFADAEFCAADEAINDIIPIVVACALAALIILVLIAYLVGRRRSRSKGYNSV